MSRSECKKCRNKTSVPVTGIWRGDEFINGPFCPSCYRSISALMDSGYTAIQAQSSTPDHITPTPNKKRHCVISKGWFCLKEGRKVLGKNSAYVYKGGKKIRIGVFSDRLEAIKAAIREAKKEGVYNATASERWLQKEHINMMDLV